MPQDASVELRIWQLAEPIADELGLDILKVSVGSGHSQLVRVIVDRAGGVDADTLERMSRGLSLQMDAEDPIQGRYRLEITSPGLDWPLTTRADFERHRDEWLAVHMRDGRTFQGWNRGATDDGFELEDAQGRRLDIRSDDVLKVHRAINWKAIVKRKK